MPKIWNEREKELIRQSLQNEGKKLFEKYGLQKTTIDEIVQSARISKGAFYLFYPSKEALFFDILETLEAQFKGKLFSEFNPSEKITREKLKAFLKELVELMTSMPIFQQVNASNYEYLLRKIPEETLNRHMKKDQNDFSRLFGYWMEQGWIRKVDMAALNGLLMSIFYFIMHQEDFGEGLIGPSLELWMDMLSVYLIP